MRLMLLSELKLPDLLKVEPDAKAREKAKRLMAVLRDPLMLGAIMCNDTLGGTVAEFKLCHGVPDDRKGSNFLETVVLIVTRSAKKRF